MVTNIHLIRHGEIDANVNRLWYGSTDSELNSKGCDQARQMGQHLALKHPYISAVYASPLKRTMKTAEALSEQLGHDLQSHAGLREYGIGVLEGTPYDHLMNDHDFFKQISADQDYAPEGGDSINMVRDRMVSALGEIAERHKGQSVAVISHGAAMAILMATVIKGTAFPFFDYHMSNTGVTHFKWGEIPTLLSFNETGHLDPIN